MLDLKKRSGLIIIFLFSCCISYAQTTIKGIIKDAGTQKPIQYVSVYFKGGKGIASSEDGTFTITTTNPKLTVLIFSYVGYKTVTKNIWPDKEQEINVYMEVAENKKGVTVKANRRGKYTNKNNPAVELIRKIIENQTVVTIMLNQ